MEVRRYLIQTPHWRHHFMLIRLGTPNDSRLLAALFTTHLDNGSCQKETSRILLICGILVDLNRCFAHTTKKLIQKLEYRITLLYHIPKKHILFQIYYS